ncbi:molybdenum cofactor biosysynthesis protein [Nocardioides sp. OK12]|uniref:MOSC domain-containing protein n=1 Tax=Nocardioides sp. OK12 TaxID=2758661 RepID=UPI0021C3BA5F|nr:MOSC N-terminal beta barrel domain-containing protein [Nocardioides sp. OK12]GHJ59518.1 molybdenum cofactor biosysynthesis protein [Nocardioides sp. OK12]
MSAARTPTLASIHRYPLKSARGERLAESSVEPWGLEGDRRWMVVDPDGLAVTAREVHPLLLLRPEITAAGLRIEAPGCDALEVATPDPARQVPVRLWRSELTAAHAGEADAWLNRVLGRPVRLVHLDDPTRRPVSAEYAAPDDRVSLADGYPLLVTTRASLAALNDQVLERSGGVHDPLPMERFRPNVVVDGVTAWAEDDWRRVRIGGVDFRAVKGCARCVITTLDPDTAEGGKEPIASLARIRRWDGATWFGTNLVPDLPDGRPVTIREGDEVEVLEGVEPGAGPIRPVR